MADDLEHAPAYDRRRVHLTPGFAFNIGAVLVAGGVAWGVVETKTGELERRVTANEAQIAVMPAVGATLSSIDQRLGRIEAWIDAARPRP